MSVTADAQYFLNLSISHLDFVFLFMVMDVWFLHLPIAAPIINAILFKSSSGLLPDKYSSKKWKGIDPPNNLAALNSAS